MSALVDLDDTGRCPTDSACAGCGVPAGEGVGGGLVVVTAGTGVGVVCLSLCPACCEAGRVPRMAVVTAALAAVEHCEHLGIDLDQMAAVMESGWDW